MGQHSDGSSLMMADIKNTLARANDTGRFPAAG